MKTGFAKQLKRAFLLHSQIVWCAVALVKQLLIGAGNRTGPVAFATFFVERAVFLCLHLPSCSPFFLFCLLSSPLLCSPLALSLSLSLCLGSPRGFCSHGWWRAKRRASLVLDGYWFDVLAEWNILCILKLMLHVQHRIWLLGVFVLLSGKHMQPTSFVLLALDLARSV